MRPLYGYELNRHLQNTLEDRMLNPRNADDRFLRDTALRQDPFRLDSIRAQRSAVDHLDSLRRMGKIL